MPSSSLLFLTPSLLPLRICGFVFASRVQNVMFMGDRLFPLPSLSFSSCVQIIFYLFPNILGTLPSLLLSMWVTPGLSMFWSISPTWNNGFCCKRQQRPTICWRDLVRKLLCNQGCALGPLYATCRELFRSFICLRCSIWLGALSKMVVVSLLTMVICLFNSALYHDGHYRKTWVRKRDGSRRKSGRMKLRWWDVRRKLRM